MKQFLIYILFFCILISATGCISQNNQSQDDINASNNTIATTPEIGNHSKQKPMVAISVPVVSESEIANDGTVIFNHTYQNISFIHPEPEIADKVILDFLNRIDGISENVETILSSAKAAYTPGKPWDPYLCQITYNPTRIDYGILSLLGSNITYSGTSHPESTYLSVTYDLVTGAVLTLDNILTDHVQEDTLCQLIIEALADQKDSLYENFEATILQRFSHGFESNESWYFSSDGLCFYFSPYEIAPYASGLITAQIPYSKLTDILDDAYFPAERQKSAGNIYATGFNNSAVENYTQLAEIPVHKDGEKILIYADELVYDVQLKTGFWNADGSAFTHEHTVFAAYMLTPGDAVKIEALLGEVMPNLMLSYVTEEEAVCRYIMLSGDNNTPVLSDA